MSRTLLDKVFKTHVVRRSRGKARNTSAVKKVEMDKDIKFVVSELSDTVKTAMQDVSRYELQRLNRLYEIHPSSFPYCPLRELYNLIERDFNVIEERTFAETYFTSVGTLVHTLIQNYIGKTGRMWGYWKCSQPECSYECKKLSVYHDCPDCGSDLDYVEIGYTYKGVLSGHSDGLYEDSKGNFWVTDYKTCLLSKAQQHRRDGVTLAGNNTYAAQQKAYVTLCQRKFRKRGIKIKGYILIYIPRDIPFQIQFVAVKVDADTKRETWKNIVKSVENHNIILDATSWQDIRPLLKDKPCSSLADYNKTMSSPYSECPLLKCCFNERNLENKLKRIVSEAVVLPLRNRIAEAIKDQNDYVESLKNE